MPGWNFKSKCQDEMTKQNAKMKWQNKMPRRNDKTKCQEEMTRQNVKMNWLGKIPKWSVSTRQNARMKFLDKMPSWNAKMIFLKTKCQAQTLDVVN